MDKKIEKVDPDKARKRSNKKTLKKQAEKRKKLYSAPGLPKLPTCGHDSKVLKCTQLNSRDIFQFHKNLYETVSKVKQDNYILKNTLVTAVKRRRPTTGSKPPRAFSVKYFIPKCNTKELVPVCKKTFLDICRLKQARIEGIAKRHFFSGGSMAKENRGGNRKKFAYAAKAEAVEKFIQSFRPLEQHYCRDTIKVRQYLHPHLNIKQMFKMYNDIALPDYEVKEGFFRMIFRTRFNIGFGSPRTDVCSFCLQMTEKIKIETVPHTKQELITTQRIHKLRAKQYFKMLQESEPDLLIISFDCEKNLPLPKIPDQATYYSRQLYLYNFTIVIGSSHDKLTPDNVHAYLWTENEAAKGSNEICSALYHCLNTIDLNNVNKIRLVCDGCGGQNKNSIIIFMIMKWLSETTTNIKDIEMVFPVTGHSFLPPDRVFALSERAIRKRENIITPEEYEGIIKEHSTIHKLSTEVQVYDWKSLSKENLRSTQNWHFQISKCKRIIFKKSTYKVRVRGEISYRNDINQSKSIIKRGKNNITNVQMEMIPTGVPVKASKINDVNNLLKKHYGTEWQELAYLQFYKNVVNSDQEISLNDDDVASEVGIGESENTEIIDFV